jgi:hypothetical protein
MRLTAVAALMLGILAANVTPGGLVSAQTKYAVTVTADQKTDFSKFQTYTWRTGQDSPDRTIHDQIVAAVDAELAKLGLKKQPSAPADLIVFYTSVQRTDIKLDAKRNAETGTRPELSVGSLVVTMRNAAGKELFRGRVDKPIEVTRAELKPVIDEAVKDVFEKYPTRTKK